MKVTTGYGRALLMALSAVGALSCASGAPARPPGAVRSSPDDALRCSGPSPELARFWTDAPEGRLVELAQDDQVDVGLRLAEDGGFWLSAPGWTTDAARGWTIEVGRWTRCPNSTLELITDEELRCLGGGVDETLGEPQVLGVICRRLTLLPPRARRLTFLGSCDREGLCLFLEDRHLTPREEDHQLDVDWYRSISPRVD